MINQVDEKGGPAVKVHRGAKAQEIRRKCAQRLIPTWWLDQWKDFGAIRATLTAQEISDNNIPEHHGAKSRWISQGFHDPDIAILNRPLATQETSDVPLCLQFIISLRGKGWVGGVRGAFSQVLRNQRKQPLFELPLLGEILNEKDDIVSFSGLICVETDHLLGGGIGFQYEAAIEVLRKECNFGKWKTLDTSTECGCRTLKQLPDYSSKVSMTRYLKEETTEIKLARGRFRDLNAPAGAARIIQLRGLLASSTWQPAKACRKDPVTQVLQH